MFHGNESLWFSLGLSVAWKSVPVLGLAWLAAVLLRRHSAAARHLAWTAAFAALLALPVLSAWLPALPLPISGALLQPVAAFATAVTAAPAHTSDTASTIATVAPQSPQPFAWQLWLILLWAGGVTIGLLQMLVGWVIVWRARRASRPLPDADRWVRALALDDHIDILVSRRGSMPSVCGWLHPAILLPADAAEWGEERLQMVLLHEAAHVRRADPATHLLARLAVHLYWWNPLAWMGWREFVKERERAADDLVVACGASASTYAGHLLDIARSMQTVPATGWAAVAMARRSQLEGRLIALFDAGTNRNPVRRVHACVAVILALAAVLPLALLHAQDGTLVLPADVEATFRAAASAKNHAMLDDAARASTAFLQYDLARKLLDHSLEIRAEVSGPQSVDYGVGLVKLGDLERSRGNLDEARAFYTKAASVLGSQPAAARPLVDLGTDALTRKDSAQALDFFLRAQTVDPEHAGVALLWQAIVKSPDHPQEAESLYRSALAVADADSPEAATAREVFANFLDKQSRADEAAPFREQAAAIRKTLAARAPLIRQAASDHPYRVADGVTPPTLSRKVEPQYTVEAKLAKYQGTAVVAVEIGPDGIARNMRVVRSLGFGLDERAVQAISQWQFKPGAKDGQPVSVMATIEVNFRLL